LLVLTGIVVLSTALLSQAPAPPAAQGVQSTALPPAIPREPSWAFQAQAGSLPAESPGPKSIPGSTRTFTPQEIDNLMAPPDWFPDAHPAAPGPVVKGRPGVLACGGCHLMSGLGHPESADLTGFTANYLTRQMLDFRSGARVDWAARMGAFAKGMTEEEIKQTSAYFASLPRVQFIRVVESAMVPKTFVGQGRMRFVDPKSEGQEPIGSRIITLPENEELARLRDPRSGFVVHVPPGSIARGRLLAESGGNGRTVVCAACHGAGLKGQGDIPRLAGNHPIYLVRQLIHFKEGTRNGPDAGQMKQAVAQLTEEDMIALAAYAGSLPPQ
jgi:cytochrome c553